jgi:hypothetical protein
MTRALSLLVALLALLVCDAGDRPVAQEEAPAAPAADAFVVYTQYNPTFVPGESRLHFTVTAYVQNSSNIDFKNLTFRRPVPEGFTIEAAPEEFQKLVRRPAEFWQKVEGNTYSMFLPELWGGRGTSIFYRLRFSGRPQEVLMPGLTIDFTADGQARSTTSPDDLINLKIYSNFSGTLRDFLKRNAEISLDAGLKGDPWRLAAIDSKALGQNPAGITGVSGDLNRGHFRLQAGLPGNYRDLLVVWWPATKDKRVRDEEMFRRRLKEYVTWVGLKQVVEDSVRITPERAFKNFKGWHAQGIWRDDVPERLGEGPFGAALFFSPVRDAEFFLFWWAQGRGMGPGLSTTPQPEKDAVLLRELEAIVESFRPFQKA